MLLPPTSQTHLHTERENKVWSHGGTHATCICTTPARLHPCTINSPSLPPTPTPTPPNIQSQGGTHATCICTTQTGSHPCKTQVRVPPHISKAKAAHTYATCICTAPTGSHPCAMKNKVRVFPIPRPQHQPNIQSQGGTHATCICTTPTGSHPCQRKSPSLPRTPPPPHIQC